MARLVTDRRDLKLDPVHWDIGFTNRDLAFSTGSDAVGQAIRYALQLLQGEWFLNRDAGTPWFQSLLGKKFELELVRSILFSRVSKLDGVAAIEDFHVGFVSATRTMMARYVVRTVFGDTINDTVELGTVNL